MTPDAYARCVTAMRGGEYVHSRQQLAEMAAAMARKAQGAVTMDDLQRGIRKALAQRPATVAELCEVVDSYPVLVRQRLHRDAGIVKFGSTYPARYTLRSAA